MSDKKLQLVLLFGGKSGEHEVSVQSAKNIYHALDQDKYNVSLWGIDKEGHWGTVPLDFAEKDLKQLKFTKNDSTLLAQLMDKKIDFVFPIIHGTYGEDGTMQGLLEILNIPYAGSGVLGSAIGMDKEVSRRLLKAAGIEVVPTLLLRKNSFEQNSKEILDQIEKVIRFPCFVKPANSGSSVGVYKVKKFDDLKRKILKAFNFDHKVLVERAVTARELECAVLGYHDFKASAVGEIIPKAEFYTYEAKYIDDNGAALKLPADISPTLAEKIQKLSIRAAELLEIRGLARIDFFLDKNNDELYLNEVNTLPGFTQISMYPKLWEISGVSYSKLIDELIKIGLQAHEDRAKEIAKFFEKFA